MGGGFILGIEARSDQKVRYSLNENFAGMAGCTETSAGGFSHTDPKFRGAAIARLGRFEVPCSQGGGAVSLGILARLKRIAAI